MKPISPAEFEHAKLDRANYVLVEYRPTIFSPSQLFVMPQGVSLKGITESLGVPQEFETHGAAYINSQVIFPDKLHLVYPKSGSIVFVSIVPRDTKGKNLFATVAALAIAAIAIFVSAGGLTILAPSIFTVGGAFAAGHVGAALAGLAFSTAASFAINQLSKPAQVGGSAANTASTATAAGVSANPLAAYEQIPCVRGKIRISPPPMALPWTALTSDGVATPGDGSAKVQGGVGSAGNNVTLNYIVGGMGPCLIEDIQINNTPIADLVATGAITYETREGWDDDAPLTLVNVSGFEEHPNVLLAKQDVSQDNVTLATNTSMSYPQPYYMRTKPGCELFRILLNFPAGLNFNAGGGTCLIPFRIRMRPVGSSTWFNLPEVIGLANKSTQFRQEVRLIWQEPANTLTSLPFENASSFWWDAYVSNPDGWDSDPYFNNGVAPVHNSVDRTVFNVFNYADRLDVILDPAQFAIGQYDVEITRGFACQGSAFSFTAYQAGGIATHFFTTQGVDGNGNNTVLSQASIIDQTYVESYTSFKDVYPIEETGLFLIAIQAKNLQVNSLNATLTSYAPIWNGADWNTWAPTRNPAALTRDALLNEEFNAQPLDLAILDDFSTFYNHCVTHSLTCDMYIPSGDLEAAATAIAACGDGILRRADKWGVIIDKDRSAEGVSQMFTPQDMTAPLNITRTFTRTPHVIKASFLDATLDYASNEIIVQDTAGVFLPFDEILDSEILAQNYSGYVTSAAVTRRSIVDLRRIKLRRKKYTFGTQGAHLRCKRGDLVGVAHDILTGHYATARVLSYTDDGSGHITTITMSGTAVDLPPANYSSLFDVEDIYALKNVFDLSRGDLGAMITLPDGVSAVIPIASVSGQVLTISGTVLVPTGMETDLVVSLGPRARVVRRCLLLGISPTNVDHQASLDLVDEASEIFAGL